MTGKLIFFDIDGTLWDWNRHIPESTVSAIKMLRENGHLVFINSGRSRSNIRSEKLMALGFDGIVAACGTHIEMNNKIIQEKLMEPDVTRLLVDTITRNRMPVVLEGPEKHWISEKGFDEDEFVDYLFETLGDAAVLLDGYSEDMKINKFSADVLVQTDYDAIKKDLSPYFYFIEHGLTPDIKEKAMSDQNRILAVIEAAPLGYSKGTAIRWLCNYLGADISDTFAVGDSANDIEMLQAAGHSIAMGNSTDAVKKISEYTTTDINDDGIYNAMKHYGLI